MDRNGDVFIRQGVAVLEEEHIDKKTKQAHTNAMLLSLSSDLFRLSFMAVTENGSCLESVIHSACPSFA